MATDPVETCEDGCACETTAPLLVPERRGYLGRAMLLAALTIGWNVLEGIVAIGPGWVPPASR